MPRTEEASFRFANSRDGTQRKGPKRAPPKPPAPAKGTPEYHVDKALEHLEKALQLQDILDTRRDAAA